MGEPRPEERSPEPVTVDAMATDLRGLGVDTGDTVLVHASLSSLGWVCGGPPAVVDAVKQVVTEAGTVVMPTHSPAYMEPSNLDNPPVPDSWHESIRAQTPPYRPAVTPTQGMGAVADCFCSYPEVQRSAHPTVSFAAWGAEAALVTDGHSLENGLGEDSPLARVYDLDGRVLFLGTTHATNTSLHLAEYRADLDMGTFEQGSAVLVDGEREWVCWTELDYDDSDFPDCGAAFEAEHPDAVVSDTVGTGDAACLEQRRLVDFATDWFERNRG